MKIVCQCGYTKTCNMSGGADESAKFDHLVTENIMAHNMNVHSTQKFLQGMNMRSKNLQGTVVGCGHVIKNFPRKIHDMSKSIHYRL